MSHDSASANTIVRCADCGPAAVNHAVERWSAILDRSFTPILKPFGAIKRGIDPLFEILGLQYPLAASFKILAVVRLGTITHDADAKDTLRTVALWDSAKKRGIVMWQFRLFGNPNVDFLVARKGGKMILFEGLPRPGKRSSAALDWMDDKGVLKKKLTAAGIPMAAGETCRTLAQARAVFRKIGPPVITKPNLGSRSRHTTVNITNEEQLTIAFKKAKQLSPWVVVEKELRGNVFRASVIGGKLAGVVRRDFAHVIGDGVRTLRQLVEEENKNPARQGPIFHTMPMDKVADEELAKQGMNRESIPRAEQIVFINKKSSRSFGAPTSDVTDSVHPDNVAVFEKVAAVLKDPLVGIDYIIEDIGRSWREQEANGVIECNSLPFLDLHQYPLFGTARDVSGMLWDLIFPNPAGG